MKVTSKQCGFCCLYAKPACGQLNNQFVGIPHHGLAVNANATCLLVTTGKVMRDSCFYPAFILPLNFYRIWRTGIAPRRNLNLT